GECTPEELKLVDCWFLSHEDNPDDDRLVDIHERENLEAKMFERIKAFVELEADVPKPLSPYRTWYRAAATLIILMVAGLGLYLYNQKGLFSEHAIAGPAARILDVNNDTEAVIRKELSDGTVIMLQPNGSLRFLEEFPADEREVVLRGEAFFDVTKDKNRPFIINTGNVTVKVLGTSFNVRAYEGANEITVAVKSGKVSVYAKGADVNTKKSASTEEIILTPNQEVVYNTIDENFLRKIVDDPQIILEKPTLFAMEYDATPVAKIFQVIEENYGIDIVYDEQALSACSLTTSMAEEGLYERIEIICQAIGAKYEVKDAKILINSDGCL
ncbi:MAG TPA: FecR domain-containing protein, partial [Chryseolinea sp.]|nr:FecR domain-containing protein [Chryseolinea sp.]